MAAQAGLKPFEVDAMDLVDVLIQIEGYDKAEREQWERSRLVGFTIHSHSMAKNRARKPEKWLPFPWDKKPVTVSSGKTPDQLREWYDKRKAEINKITQLQNGG